MPEVSTEVRIVGVIQARTQSTRLPGKVLLPLGDRPLLAVMLGRLAYARELDQLVVATTDLPVDRPIAMLAAGLGISCICGHPTDLLDRHLMVARATGADAIVKIPSDCPLIDPRIVDQVVGTFRQARGRFDYVSNLHPGSWPDGNDVEVFTRQVLEEAFDEADRPYEREHTTPFIWDQPDRYRLRNVEWGGGRDLSRSHRLTIDYPEDLEVVAAVQAALGGRGAGSTSTPFSVDEVVTYLDAHPAIRERNASRRNTGWPIDHAHAFRTLRAVTLPRPSEVQGDRA